MPGTDLDTHALAADIRNLSHKIDAMQQESRDWRDKQMKIFEAMADNKESLAKLTQRLSALSARQTEIERELSAVVAWKWKSVGVLTGVAFVINWIVGNT